MVGYPDGIWGWDTRLQDIPQIQHKAQTLIPLAYYEAQR